VNTAGIGPAQKASSPHRAQKKQPAALCAAGPLCAGSIAGTNISISAYALFGHSQPFSQSSQHAHLQLHFGQLLQQSFEQHAWGSLV